MEVPDDYKETDLIVSFCLRNDCWIKLRPQDRGHYWKLKENMVFFKNA